MSKKYKLLKDLPGVSAGAEIIPTSGLAFGYRISQCVHYEWANDYILAHPDWFEEVKPEQPFQWIWTDALVAEYSLTEQKMTQSEFKRFVQQREQSKQSPPTQQKEWEVIKSHYKHGHESEKCFVIDSVKRLSDGEVFSIGDMVGYDNGNTRTKKDWAIDNFFIRESDGLLLARSKDNLNVEIVDKWLYKGSPTPLPKEERIKVKQMFDLNNIYQPQCVRTGFVTSHPIPEDKFPLIKQAIEQILNT